MLRRIQWSLVAWGLVNVGSAGAVVSFPGALGFGNGATGGRGGTVYHVTNLDDAGAGSFRDAVSKSNRIVVFDVGGYITLKTAVSMASNLTIAGQTAPGEGIGFRGGKLSMGKQSNIIIRHIRIRPGSEVASNEDVAINLYNAHNVIVDHASIEFAPWNNIGGVSDDWQNYPVTNITFQNCLIANPTYQQFGAHCESVSSDWSWYYNAFVNSHNRNPLAKTNTVFVNNIAYNNEASYTTHTSTNFKHDIVNNYFIYGPSSSGNTWYQIDKNQSIHYSGNLLDTDKNGALSGATTTPYWYQGTGTVLSAPWSTVTSANPIYTAASAFRIVTSRTGTLPVDQMDSLVWSQVNTLGKGTAGQGAGTAGPSSLYTSQTGTGLGNNGYGVIRTGTKAADTDNDGMPDYWETAMGSNLSKDDAMTIGTDGYALIEQYINWLGDMHAQAGASGYADVDLRAFTQGFQGVAPTYTVANASKGTAALQSNGYTARFTPSASGVGSFQFTVKGSDATTWTGTVYVLSGANVNNAPVFTSAKSLSVIENTTAVVKCVATDADGQTVTYAITGGEDSALFAIDKTSGQLSFKAAPLFASPKDQGADNVYKVIVGASDGKTTTTQSIAVAVTQNTSGVRRESAAGLVPARVVWLDVQGHVLRVEGQNVDPEAPRPLVPAGLRGVLTARVFPAGAPAVTVRATGF